MLSSSCSHQIVFSLSVPAFDRLGHTLLTLLYFFLALSISGQTMWVSWNEIHSFGNKGLTSWNARSHPQETASSLWALQSDPSHQIKSRESNSLPQRIPPSHRLAALVETGDYTIFSVSGHPCYSPSMSEPCPFIPRLEVPWILVKIFCTNFNLWCFFQKCKHQGGDIYKMSHLSLWKEPEHWGAQLDRELHPKLQVSHSGNHT